MYKKECRKIYIDKTFKKSRKEIILYEDKVKQKKTNPQKNIKRKETFIACMTWPCNFPIYIPQIQKCIKVVVKTKPTTATANSNNEK